MRLRGWISVLGGVAALLVVARPGQGPALREVGVGRELVGVWRSSDPRYLDRFLQVGPDEIVFGQGEDGAARHRLVGVFLEDPVARPGAYVLRYWLDDTGSQEATLRLHLAEGALRLDSQPTVVWTR